MGSGGGGEFPSEAASRRAIRGVRGVFDHAYSSLLRRPALPCTHIIVVPREGFFFPLYFIHFFLLPYNIYSFLLTY